jgi:tetratricopeptide (TPR) repeat protein
MCTYQTMHAWDWRGAVTSAQRALQLAPDDVGALKEAARLYYALGRSQDALGYAERAVTLDPLNSVCYWYLASSLGVLGRIGEAETAIRKALELSPDAPSLHFRLAFFLDRLGRHEDAIAEASRERTDWARLFALGILHFRQGNVAEADRALNTLIECCGENACIQIAMNYCVRGDADRAFDWLERAFALRDTGLSYVKSGWLTHPIQADPRWPVFLRKMGFEEYDSAIGP